MLPPARQTIDPSGALFAHLSISIVVNQAHSRHPTYMIHLTFQVAYCSRLGAPIVLIAHEPKSPTSWPKQHEKTMFASIPFRPWLPPFHQRCKEMTGRTMFSLLTPLSNFFSSTTCKSWSQGHGGLLHGTKPNLALNFESETELCTEL